MTKRQFLNRFLQLLLLAAICYFFAPSFVDSFKKFNPSAWEINYPLLVASLLLMQVVLYAQSAIWSTIITFFDKKVSYQQGLPRLPICRNSAAICRDASGNCSG